MGVSRQKAGRSPASAARRQERPGDTRAVTGARRQPYIWLLLPALLLVTLSAYSPAWHGGRLWDDDSHITHSALRSTEGLWRIWFDLGATQQYYPAVHTAFWIQHRLWGDDTFGYHIVNILLHVFSAFLLALILRRLAVPGAILAAVLFALHPVQVESVAWIAELKNTLSGLFYLSAALAYLHFDSNRKMRSYAFALFLFLLALFSKTVTATLPAALLVVFWWKRGQLNWRSDVRPLLPFFALAAGGGLVTAWVEHSMIGAQGAEFQFSFIERCLIAGRAVWFYLAKLLWPANLIFIYPRWHVSQSVWWQYLYPLSLMALMALLWLLRKRSRAPLAAMLFFCGTLFPALGFFNVFPFRYSFVADHFQYLAGIAVFALFSAGLASLAKRLNLETRPVASAAALLAVGVALAIPTWNQSRQYTDAETLYSATLRRNPECWLAENNLGMLMLDDRLEEALAHFQRALRLKPDIAEAHSNLGNALQRMGRYDEAISHYTEALRLKPDLAEAHNNLGNVLLKLGRAADAIIECEQALRLDPDYSEAHRNLGKALQRVGRQEDAIAQLKQAIALQPDNYEAGKDFGDILQSAGRSAEAAAQYRQTLRLRPDNAGAHNNLGYALQEMGRLEEAIVEYREALRLMPDFVGAHINLGNALLQSGRPEEAASRFREGMRLNPDLAEAHNNLGFALQASGRLEEAAGRFREALALKPDYAAAYYNLANALLRMGRRAEAVAQYKEALKHRPDSYETHNNLGVALEELGRLNEAAEEYREALRLNPNSADARDNVSRIATLLRK